MTLSRHMRPLAIIFLLLVPHQALAAGASAARDHGRPARQKTASQAKKLKKALQPKLPADIREDYQKYCYNISDAARDARYALQKHKLEALEGRLNELLRKLEKRKREYMTWVLRRKEITGRMTRAMLDVYAKMEPEAAASQISRMEYAVAIAILTGLKPQKASAILTEMDPKKAGKLVNVIVGAVAEGARPARGETN